MQIHRLPSEKIAKFPSIALALGNFDGLHLGHRHLLEKVLQEKGPTGIFTFDPHPMKILPKGQNFQQIWPREELALRLEEMGIDHLFLCGFTTEFSKKSPLEFIEETLLPIGPKKIIVGFDFHFGHDRAGSTDLLQKLLSKNGIDLEIVEEQKINGVKSSSGEVKRLLIGGNVKEAQKLLGEPYYLRGTVTTGDQRGHQIGFPTANLTTNWDLMIKVGVYKTMTEVGGKKYLSVTNVGAAPTFLTTGEVKVETHILDFDEKIYDQAIKVEFLDYLRPEKKFSSKNELIEQIQKDIERARG